MGDFIVLEPAIDPNNRISFLLDWELTMKCNLDCSYCTSGPYGGHDNSTRHPDLEKCLETIDFMYQYVDLYMSRKPKGIRYVSLNVYGGESLYHPDILKILQACRERHTPYQDKWNLSITTTTNAIVPSKKFLEISKFIDEFTCSFHSENSDKQKTLFKKNLLLLRDHGKKAKCVILMHPQGDLFAESKSMIEWCDYHGIKYLPRQLDNPSKVPNRQYTETQVIWFESLYHSKSYRFGGETLEIEKNADIDEIDMSEAGRGCCGGRQICPGGNQKNRAFFVANKFPDWYCSVNEFFVYIKQVNGEIFVNKDCKMGFHGKVEPIGHLSWREELLSWTKKNIEENTMPIIQCKKYSCFCGLCSPKAKNLNDYQNIMGKYRS